MSNAHASHGGAGMSRRRVLRAGLAAAASVPCLAGAKVMLAPVLPAVFLPAVRKRGAAILNVRDYGAVGNGVHDDTAAIQAAINALPADGGTVLVPPGTYMIDTTRKVNLRSSMLLMMDPDAILKAKPASVARHYILYVNGKTDVEIAGGQLLGERDTHTYLTTGTDEWGHGIQILGGRGVTIRDLRVSRCTGDGVCIGGGSSDVVIANIVSTQNRRQGLSITNCSNIRVHESEFSHTQGTAPECGIDLEPDDGYTCSDVVIEDCRLNDNAKYGINIWKRVSRVTIARCMIESNGSLGMSTYGCSNIRMFSNTLRYNSATGVVYNDGTVDVSHEANLSYGNYARLGSVTRTPFTLAGWSSKIERDILLRGTLTDVRILTNNYR